MATHRRTLIWRFGLAFVLPLLAAGQTSPLVDALNLLESGNYAQAANRLEQAGVRQSTDARSLLTLGVALTLAERFDDAVEPLERAVKLQRLDEATLWLYTCEKMSGIVTEGHAYHIRRPGEPLRIEGSPKYQSGEYPSQYASFIYNSMASAYMGARLDRLPTNTPAIRALLLDGARRFTALRWAAPDLARAARTTASATDYPRQMLRLLQSGNPGDPAWLNELGALHLSIGRYIGARRYSTLLLLQQPTHATALIRRAWAAARMGDAQRARAAVSAAQAANPTATANLRSRIEGDLAANQPPGDAYAYLNDLAAATRSGASLAALLPKARLVHAAFAGRRLVYEERYAADRAAFENALRAQPGSADVRANYARFLIDESDIYRRAYSLEPRPVVEAFRLGFNAQQERALALTVVNQALAANPNHVRSLLLKAIVLDRLGRFEEGRPFADKALRLAPTDPEALRLRSEYLWSANIDALNRAMSLRAPTVEGVRTYDEGPNRVTETTYRGPSQAERNAAGALENSARELRAGARAALQAALQASAGTPEGAILEAESAVANGRLDAARDALARGVARFPRSVPLHEAYVRYAQRTRNDDLEDDERSIAFDFFETTAGPQLRKAWRAILRTDWPAADRALIEAARLDPTDARTPAYRAIALEQQNRRADAAALWMQAIALEDARLSYDESPTSAGVSRSPTSTALAIALRLRFLGDAKDHPAAPEVARGAALLAERLSPPDRAMLCWRALLPDPRIEERPGWQKNAGVRWAPNAASLAAAGHVAYGRTLRGGEAQAQFEKALAWGQPNGVNIPRSAGTSSPAELERDFDHGVAKGAIAEAYLEMARLAVTQGDERAALDYFNKATGAKPSLEVQRELDKLLDTIRNPSPTPRRRR